MKRLGLFFIVFMIIAFDINTKAFRAKTIDLKIKAYETDVVFIRLKGSVSLLINDGNDSNLFIIEYKNDQGLEESVRIFKSKPNVFYLNKNIDKVIDNVHVFKQKDVLKFRINNYTLCINDENTKACDFIYLIKLDKPFFVNNNISSVFYDEYLNKKFLKGLEESWIDSTIISCDSFTILKISEENYNILVVPSTNI